MATALPRTRASGRCPRRCALLVVAAARPRSAVASNAPLPASWGAPRASTARGPARSARAARRARSGGGRACCDVAAGRGEGRDEVRPRLPLDATFTRARPVRARPKGRRSPRGGLVAAMRSCGRQANASSTFWRAVVELSSCLVVVVAVLVLGLVLLVVMAGVMFVLVACSQARRSATQAVEQGASVEQAKHGRARLVPSTPEASGLREGCLSPALPRGATAHKQPRKARRAEQAQHACSVSRSSRLRLEQGRGELSLFPPPQTSGRTRVMEDKSLPRQHSMVLAA